MPILLSLFLMATSVFAEVLCEQPDEVDKLNSDRCDIDVRGPTLKDYPAVDKYHMEFIRQLRATEKACSKTSQIVAGKAPLPMLEFMAGGSVVGSSAAVKCEKTDYAQKKIKMAQDIKYYQEHGKRFHEKELQPIAQKLAVKNKFKFESVSPNGDGFTALYKFKETDANFVKAGIAEKEFNAESAPLINMYKEKYLPKTESEAEEIIRQRMNVLCFDQNEKEIQKRLTMEGCDIPASLNLPRYSPAPVKSTLHPSLTSQGHKMLVQMETLIRSNQSCSAKMEGIQSLLSSTPLTNLDDLAIMSYLAKNPGEVLSNPYLRASLAAVMHSGETQPLKPFCDFLPNCETVRNRSMPEFRNALIAYQLEALSEAGLGADYDNFDKITDPAAREKVALAIAEKFGKGIKDKDARAVTARNFQKRCDEKVSRVFGNSNGMATVSGYGHMRGKDQLELGAYDSYERAHFYTDSKLSDKLDQPFYAPKGCNKSVSPGGTKGIGSYVIHCPNFGRYKNVVFNPNHLNPESRTFQQNSSGSFQIGLIGGDGGGGKNDRKGNEQCDYVHIHMQLFQGNGKTLLNFVDAFCRN